jgi:hypothetical protein
VLSEQAASLEYEGKQLQTTYGLKVKGTDARKFEIYFFSVNQGRE